MGSTRGLVTSGGQLAASYSYTPYGSVKAHAGSFYTPFLYAGQYTDGETGFQYLQARYYDPATSQFLSIDPLVQQTQQPYAYVSANPLNGTDPWGLAGCNGASGTEFWARLGSSFGDLGCNFGEIKDSLLTGQSTGTTRALAGGWNDAVKPTLYRAAERQAGFFDSITNGGFTWLAGQVGAHADICSYDYLTGRYGPTLAAGLVAPPARGYHNETIDPRPMRPEDAVNDWESFLGPGPYTNMHPRTGLPDPNRLVSADGLRSIRFGPHEMNSTPTNFHYHREQWTYDPANNVMNVDNELVRVPIIEAP